MNKDAVAEMSQQYQVAAAEKLVPEGYKQTEVGVIPEDWEAIKMGGLAQIQRGASPRPIDSPVWFDRNSSVGWLRISDASKAKKYLIKTVQALSEKGIAHSRFVPKNNLVMSICATVGKPVITKKDLCIHDGFVVFNNLNAHQEYMYYVLEELEDEWGKQGQTGSQMNLNTDLINSTYIALPKKPEEQAAIANALSDTDALLSELEKLIAKKQAIKTATMQQLLTGRTRLPQFAHHPDGSKKGYKQSELGEIPEDWYVVPLGKLASIKTGSKNNQDKVADGIYPFFVRSETVERLNSYSYDCEAILVPGEGGIGSIFHYINGKFDAHQRVYVIREFVNCSGKYVYFQMRQHFGAHAMENSVKATVDSLRLPTFQEFSVPVPHLEEQTAIATILSDMDAEIQALEHRLNKTREIKQGMMQELLTGKTRLIKGGKNV